MSLQTDIHLQVNDTVSIIGERGVHRITKILHDKAQLDGAFWKPLNQLSLVFTDMQRPETWPYAIKDRRMIYLSETAEGVKELPIADFFLLVKERIITENGDIWKMEGEAVRGGKFTVEIPAADFADDQKLKRAVDAGSGPLDPVRARMGGYLGAAIQTLSQQEQIVTTRRFYRTGWSDGAFVIPGREQSDTSIELPQKLAFALHADADVEKGRECLVHLCDAHDGNGIIVLTFMFQPPLSHLMGWNNERYALFVRGRTGSLKTSFAQTALAMYGAGFTEDTNLIKFGEGATRNALMQIAAHASDVPLLFDNFKPNTGWGSRDFINLIHNILEGGEKERLNRSSELRKSRQIHTWPLITGEDVPDTDAASLARVLVVPFDWKLSGINESLAAAQEIAATGDFTAVGKLWIDWLESAPGAAFVKARSGQFVELRNTWAASLLETQPEMVNPMRVASNLATNQMTFECACEVFPELREYADEYMLALRGIAGGMAENTSVAIEAERFIAALRELLASGRYVLRGLNDELGLMGLGWMNGDGSAYLMPVIARRAVEDLLGRDDLNGISNNALYAQLRERGYLIPAAEKTTVTKRLAGGVKRVLHLTHRAIESLADDGD